MVRQLPKFMHMNTGRVYYLDVLLKEYRAVHNPHDRIPMATEQEFKPVGGGPKWLKSSK
jgi:hypothetical protein